VKQWGPHGATPLVATFFVTVNQANRAQAKELQRPSLRLLFVVAGVVHVVNYTCSAGTLRLVPLKIVRHTARSQVYVALERGHFHVMNIVREWFAR
jgi:hypothetical protein